MQARPINHIQGPQADASAYHWFTVHLQVACAACRRQEANAIMSVMPHCPVNPVDAPLGPLNCMPYLSGNAIAHMVFSSTETSRLQEFPGIYVCPVAGVKVVTSGVHSIRCLLISTLCTAATKQQSHQCTLHSHIHHVLCRYH